MKNRSTLALVSLVVTLLAAGCGGGGGSTGSLKSDDVLVVGGQHVSKDDLDVMMTRARKSYEANKQKFPKPGTAEFLSLQGQAVTYLLQRAELAERAEDIGVHVSDKQVDDRVNLVKKQSYGNDEKKFEAALAQQGLTVDQYKVFEKFQIISEEVYKKLTDKVHVSDAAIKDYYEKNRSVYKQKESRDVRHILVNKESLANQIQSQLVAAHEKNFAKLAKKYSKDPSSAANGGKLTIVRGQTVPPFDKTAFSLKKGELSRPVHTQFGWHVIQALSAIKPATTTPLGKVKESIRQQLEQTKKNEVMTKWVNDMQKSFCMPGRIKYRAGYQPTTDPCASYTSSTAATATQ
jgi:parvulin-like peptidyl-prolyl isomerase